MSLPQKYLPVSPRAKRVRLDLEPATALDLAQRAAGLDLSLASYCRVLCEIASAGRISDSLITRTAAPLRMPRQPATDQAKRPRGRPRKKISTK